MIYEEAYEKAQRIVFVHYNLPDIVSACELYDIPTHTKSGRLRARPTLEKLLIEAMTKEFEE